MIRPKITELVLLPRFDRIRTGGHFAGKIAGHNRSCKKGIDERGPVVIHNDVNLAEGCAFGRFHDEPVAPVRHQLSIQVVTVPHYRARGYIGKLSAGESSHRLAFLVEDSEGYRLRRLQLEREAGGVLHPVAVGEK